MKYLLFMFLFSISIIANAQKDIEDGWYMVQSGTNSNPGYLKKVKALHVFNGVLIRDSISCVKLMAESKNFKTKIKKKDVSKNLLQILELDNEYYYFFKIIEIKDIIIDPETMRLIKIK